MYLGEVRSAARAGPFERHSNPCTFPNVPSSPVSASERRQLAIACNGMLEDPSLHRQALHVPRASLVLPAGEGANRSTEIWMGGAHSHLGVEFAHETLRTSWVIDCAGEIDAAYRESAGRWLPCVFPDLDGPLPSSNRVADVVQAALESIFADAAPERVYVMCQHGMNRSGLVAGLLLRGLGIGPREAIDRIRAARPGALANDHFRLMVLGHA